MISVVTLWESVTRAAKSGTSGYQDATDFNTDLSSVQTGLMGLLAPLYGSNQAVQDLLAPFIEPLTGTSSASGVLSKPADYFQIASVTVSGYPAFPVMVNEVPMLQFIPSRRPSAPDNRYYYFLRSDEINILPAAAVTVSGAYIRHPDPSEIVLTPVSTPDDDYLTPTANGDLEWPERAFNLILNMMLLKLGLSSKEQLLLEFADMDIKMEASKLNAIKQ